MAILGAFVFSVPYMESRDVIERYNRKTFVELLNLSQETQHIIKTQIYLYSDVLYSWKMYNQRIKLLKSKYSFQIL